MNDLVKQAYVQGLAARAILRARVMEKVAAGAADEDKQSWGDYGRGLYNATKGRIGDLLSRAKTPLMWGGGGAAGGAALGALIAHARKKNLLRGALIGGGIGGIAGLGANELRDINAKARDYRSQS